MKNWMTLLLLTVFMVACGQDELTRNSFQTSDSEQNSGEVSEIPDTMNEQPLEPDTSKCGDLENDECVVVSALYRHCAACHAIGNKRFIFDESYENTFEYITTVNYEGNTSWVTAIRDSIDWPGGDIPDYGLERESEKQFMPLGKKRQHMNEEEIGGQPVQQLMLEVLNRYAN